MNGLWRRLQQWLGLKKFVIPTQVEDLPDALELSRLYLVGSEAEPWSAALLCPCGCRSLIQLSLIVDDDPRWTLSYDVNRSATLHPSIWRIKGCRSHFFIRANEIIWAKDGLRFNDKASPQGQPNGRLLDRTIGRRAGAVHLSDLMRIAIDSSGWPRS